MKAKRNSKVVHSTTTREDGGVVYKLDKQRGVPPGWNDGQLKDYITLVSGQHLEAHEYHNTKGKGMPYFTGPSDFTNSIEKVHKWTNRETKSAKTGDVLVTVKGSGVGQLHFLEIDQPVAIGRQLMALRNKTADSKFLHYLLSSKAHQLELLSRGNMIPGVTRDDILTLKASIPPLPEQKKIALILSTWDRAIEKTEQLIAQKQQLKRGLMQLLLTGKVRFKEFVKSNRMKKTKLGMVPEDWTIKTLEEMGEVISGLTYSPEDVRDKGLLVLRSSNIQNGVLEFDNNVFVDPDKVKFNAVKRNDILICVRNGSKDLIGKSTLITSAEDGMAFGAFMSVYRSTLNGYISKLFQTRYYSNEIEKNLGATINSINGSSLKRFRFPFPTDKKELEQITRVLTASDEEVLSIQNVSIRLKHEKQGLMQVLLTGNVRTNSNSK